MWIKANDNVKVISGEDRGTETWSAAGEQIYRASVLAAVPPPVAGPVRRGSVLVDGGRGHAVAHGDLGALRVRGHSLAGALEQSPAQLPFEAPDHDRFRCLKLALECLDRGCMSPTILNAANEIAVEAFLNGRIGFLDIARVVETTLDECPGSNVEAQSLDGVLATDARARELARTICRRMMI